jgi:hypothetical protein
MAAGSVAKKNPLNLSGIRMAILMPSDFQIIFLEHCRGATVGKLHQIGKLIIRVYANDHLPPHFHAIAPDSEALVEIETLTIMRGRLPPRTRKRS